MPASQTAKKSRKKSNKKKSRKKSRTKRRNETGKPGKKTSGKSPGKRTRTGVKPRAPRAPRAKARTGTRRDAAFRLDPEVRPIATDIHLDLDPSRSARYTGEVGITLQLRGPRRRIELHACEISVRTRATVHVAGERRTARVVPHPERETVEVVFDRPIPAGQARLELGFSGRIRKDLSGLYAVESDGRQFAFSQLAPTHARRFVPCFDEPAMKSRFRVAVTTGARNTVIANSPIETEEPLDDGRKTVHFTPTPPISSYLLALAVGELAHSRTVACGETPITVWHVPGHETLCEFALEVAHDTLARLEEWFGQRHPYPKLDLVAVPEFEYGAMENAGAVFFRETLLLIDPVTSSVAERKRVAEVICHELAHMWYGNLVTMAWWDDLWLNEAFATWMAFEILDAWRPDWKIWQTFQQRRSAALDADALANTHAIHTAVASAEEAAENFDLITYEKGASVIRMLAGYLQKDVFQNGVRTYIRRHRESNAVAADLWQALTEASGEPIDHLVRAWLEEPGHPVVRVSRRERNGLGVVELRQWRMRMTPERRRAGARRSEPRWSIPMVGRIGTVLGGETREVRHLFSRARESIPAQGADLAFLYANANESGFYRPLHDADVFEDLVAGIASLRPIERQGLIDHQWALVRSGDAPLAGMLDLAARLGDDDDPEVLAAVAVPLASLCKRLAPDFAPACEERLRAWVEVYYGGQVDELGFAPLPDEDPRTGLRRAEILRIVGVIGESSDVLAEATVRCLRYLEDRASLAPDLCDVVVGLAAMCGGPSIYDAFHIAMRKAATPQEQKRFLLALADFGQPELIDRTLALCLGDEVGSQDVAFVLIRLLENRHARERTWAFIRRRWSTLKRHLPPALGNRLIQATPALLTRDHRREVAAFFRAHPLPASDRAVRQALERFDWYAGFRRRVGPELVAYLSGTTTP